MSAATHDQLILDQFTRQAAPFSAAAMITDARALQLLVAAAQPTAEDTVLDVCCGPGLVVCALAPFVQRATGIDFTPAMLDKARALTAEHGVRNVVWDQGDAYALPFADCSFTIVVTRYSLHHLEHPLTVLNEMTRVCVPGGRIVVVDAYAPEAPEQAAEYHRLEVLRDPSHARSLSFDQLTGLFAAAGLGTPRVERYELRVELADLLARAFPNPGDEAEIAAVFNAAADDNRLGIPVRRDGQRVHIAYQAAILAAIRPSG